jgi:hypothetical protein
MSGQDSIDIDMPSWYVKKPWNTVHIDIGSTEALALRPLRPAPRVLSVARSESGPLTELNSV